MASEWSEATGPSLIPHMFQFRRAGYCLCNLGVLGPLWCKLIVRSGGFGYGHWTILWAVGLSVVSQTWKPRGNSIWPLNNPWQHRSLCESPNYQEWTNGCPDGCWPTQVVSTFINSHSRGRRCYSQIIEARQLPFRMRFALIMCPCKPSKLTTPRTYVGDLVIQLLYPWHSMALQNSHPFSASINSLQSLAWKPGCRPKIH